jgi:hypothetical protein
VHLGDLPANISGRRLGDGIWRATLPRAALLAASAIGSIAGALTHTLPGMPIQCPLQMPSGTVV